MSVSILASLQRKTTTHSTIRYILFRIMAHLFVSNRSCVATNIRCDPSIISCHGITRRSRFHCVQYVDSSCNDKDARRKTMTALHRFADCGSSSTPGLLLDDLTEGTSDVSFYRPPPGLIISTSQVTVRQAYPRHQHHTCLLWVVSTPSPCTSAPRDPVTVASG